MFMILNPDAGQATTPTGQLIDRGWMILQQLAPYSVSAARFLHYPPENALQSE